VGYDLYVFCLDFGNGAEPEELAECDIGDFCDLAFFRSSVDCNLGAGRYPTLKRLSGCDCFRDANGANLFECLLELCAVAIEHERPIIFV
jgi:hypothetical protein